MDAWLALERQVLFTLALIGVTATAIGCQRPSSLAAPLAGAAVGAAFFIWIDGVRLIMPTEYWWTFKLDWRVHFLGWHLFRSDGWHLPPGRIDGYGVPIGTAIGLTDSIPIAAFLLKPFAPALPMPFQYLGAWLCLCFVLQGFFGALMARLWSRNGVVQVLAGCCFVLVPTLLIRELHPALCAHWLLLWAIWLYFSADRARRAPLGQIAVLALIAGLVHPYLAAMVAALIGALAVRLLADAGHVGWPQATRNAIVVLGLAAGGVLGGWWASGLFTVSGANLAVGGFGEGAMNLLAPMMPFGWSTLLPEWWKTTSVYWYEGFQYLGAGLLALVGLAIVAPLVRRIPFTETMWPLVAVCAVLALYAACPRVTLGHAVIVRMDWLEPVSVFRATGRFFWPAGYLVIAAALGTLIVRMPARLIVPLLAGVIALQVVDLRAEYTSRRATRRDPAWYTWAHPLASAAWHDALPHYDHMVIYQPPHCGPSPTPFEDAAYLAGIYGLTINGMLAARADARAWGAACAELDRSLLAGEVDPYTIYLGAPVLLPGFRANARRPIVCGVIDGVGVCVTADSYARWRHAARLE